MKNISLRMLSGLIIGFVLCVGVIFILLFNELLDNGVQQLVGGSTLPPEIQQQLFIIFVGQGIFTILTFSLVAFVVAFTLERMVIKPLHTLSKAISQFGDGMKSTKLPQVQNASMEIQNIFESFQKMAAHVEEAQKREEEISHMKSDFISTAAHQLRTPLTGIRWTLEALEKEQNVSNETQEMIADALKKNKQLVTTVRTLLDVSAIEAGHYTYTFKQTNIVSSIHTAIEGLKEHATRREVSVSFVTPHASPLVRADEERIQWVLSNLIENAIRYTPHGGKVILWIEEKEDIVWVFVHDTGIGIPPEERVNIFERFYRGKKASAMQNEGNGLGLYIARNIIRDHKGELLFRANEEGAGTTFYFSLPLFTKLQ